MHALSKLIEFWRALNATKAGNLSHIGLMVGIKDCDGIPSKDKFGILTVNSYPADSASYKYMMAHIRPAAASTS